MPFAAAAMPAAFSRHDAISFRRLIGFDYAADAYAAIAAAMSYAIRRCRWHDTLDASPCASPPFRRFYHYIDTCHAECAQVRTQRYASMLFAYCCAFLRREAAMSVEARGTRAMRACSRTVE